MVGRSHWRHYQCITPILAGPAALFLFFPNLHHAHAHLPGPTELGEHLREPGRQAARGRHMAHAKYNEKHFLEKSSAVEPVNLFALSHFLILLTHIHNIFKERRK
ncbi:hypothetical protein PUN28_004583 [Cardiocondyla obscurior]|uniref:Secreted protein n=1 Tax=Cardiocondyla obscurior TaxID=286306 RepID=A0AAW2GE88_9HYME